jgi:hypothetical protein
VLLSIGNDGFSRETILYAALDVFAKSCNFAVAYALQSFEEAGE